MIARVLALCLAFLATQGIATVADLVPPMMG